VTTIWLFACAMLTEQSRRRAQILIACGVLSLSASTAAEPLAGPRLADAAQAERLSLAWDVPNPAWTYTLLTDAWWANDSAVSHTRCSGPGLAACTLESSLVPSTPVVAQLLATDPATGIEAGRSVTVAFAAAERGACGTQPDALVWRDSRAHLRADVTGCLESCSIAGGDCTEACVLAKAPFSKTCGACWSTYYDCAAEHCAVSCGIAPKSSRCHVCTEAACTASGLSCTGMPQWAWTNEEQPAAEAVATE
jgi:hypothetical protein